MRAAPSHTTSGPSRWIKGKSLPSSLTLRAVVTTLTPPPSAGLFSPRGSPLPVVLEAVFPHGPILPAAHPRIAQSLAPVSVGTPQGSPVSPLLFVLYVSPLHREIPYGLTLSNVDDFALTATSAAYPSQRPTTARAVCHTESQRLPPWSKLLHSQN